MNALPKLNLIGRLKLVVLLLASILFRPTLLGLAFTTAGIVVMLSALALHWLDMTLQGKRMTLSRRIGFVVLCASALWIYLLAQGGLIASAAFVDVLKATVANISVAVAGGIILSDEATNIRFFRLFIALQIGLIVSYWITFILAVGLPIEKLYIFQLPVQGYIDAYPYAGDTYLPLTITSGAEHSHGFTLIRLIGIFREPGVAQAFFIWSFFNAERFGYRKLWVKIVLAGGVLATFSTTGIALFVLLFSISKIIERKPVYAFGMLLVSVIVILYAPGIGLMEKTSGEHGYSVQARNRAITEGLEKLGKQPMGVGMYNSETSFSDAGINLPGLSYMIGVIGLLLVFCVYLVPIAQSTDKKVYLFAALPFFLTAMTAEPFVDAPLLYLMLMANLTALSDKKLLPVQPASAWPELMPGRQQRIPTMMQTGFFRHDR